MNRDFDVDLVLREYFADDGTPAPDQILDVIEERIMRQPQRRARRAPWGDADRNTSLTAVLAMAAVILVAVAGVAVLRPHVPGVGGPPEPTVSPTPSPIATPSPTATPSSSVGVTRACDLMTADEVADALDISTPVDAESKRHLDSDEVLPPTVFSGLCDFRTGDGSLFVLRYEPGPNGADAFAIWKNQPGVEAVSGLGDDAVWAPAKTTLYVLKGDGLLTILPLDGPDPTLTLEAVTAIAAIVVTRM